jgi:hypothetical protein
VPVLKYNGYMVSPVENLPASELCLIREMNKKMSGFTLLRMRTPNSKFESVD